MDGKDFVGEATHLGKAGKIGERDSDAISARMLSDKAARRLGPGAIAEGSSTPACQAEIGADAMSRVDQQEAEQRRRLRSRVKCTG
jgi:hypothetical protein